MLWWRIRSDRDLHHAAALALRRCISLAARHLQGSLRLGKIKATVEGKRMNSEKASGHPWERRDAHSQNEATEQNIAKPAPESDQFDERLSAEDVEWKVSGSGLGEVKAERDGRRDDPADVPLETEETRPIALKDALTGLPNRLAFDQLLEYGLSQATRHQWGLAVLFVAVDQFTTIHDADGHDQVLQMVATRITSFLRLSDTVSRWGGDQFVCLLPEVKNHADITNLAVKMVARIVEPCVLDWEILRVRASIGIAIFPAHGTTAETLLSHAGAAMDEAKGAEARVVLFRRDLPFPSHRPEELSRPDPT
jgi:diguanylate cyclase (GGDEF)-like protein